MVEEIKAEQSKNEQVKTPVGIAPPAISATAGAMPDGAKDERSAAQAVREMFDGIAPRYDFLNHALSMNVDRLWWRRTARIFRHILSSDQARVLDLCAGTGDMSMALRAVATRQNSNATIYALDFSHQMLRHGLAKYFNKNVSPLKPTRSSCPCPAAVWTWWFPHSDSAIWPTTILA
jgi:demethylmenaquinone methyltransferase/2-methoxy-6-polyprenyl-1,4-benzoquinol methylase